MGFYEALKLDSPNFYNFMAFSLPIGGIITQYTNAILSETPVFDSVLCNCIEATGIIKQFEQAKFVDPILNIITRG